MHAILAMAASHLQLTTGYQMTTVAIRHRLLAIKGSNEVISQPVKHGSDGDALLASCYLLAFQSSYMADGMEESFRIVRGCTLLNMHLKAQHLHMAFFLPHNYHFDIMQQRLVDLPTIEPGVVKSAETSLQNLLPHLTDSRQKQIYQRLMDIVDSLNFSSLKCE
jgi:hypothetical protein